VTVPFPGAAPAVSATLGGHTPIGFMALPPALNNLREGKLRGLALLAAKRSPFLPDLPTNAEAGVPGLESDTLTGMVAPAGTARDIVEKWCEAIAKLAGEPDIRQRLEALGFVPVANTPDEFGERIKSEIARWSDVVRDANIKAE
jgi:tripartite-type tricarboxylate transporter receptor subunit TctC